MNEMHEAPFQNRLKLGRKKWRVLFLSFFLLVFSQSCGLDFDTGVLPPRTDGDGDDLFPPPNTEDPSEEMVLNVDVYLLKFSSYPALDSQYNMDELNELFFEINKIWEQANIRWRVDSVSEFEVSPESFTIPPDGFGGPRPFRNAMANFIPPPTQSHRWPVYIMRQFPIQGSGVYIVERRSVLYGELSQHGSEEPVILAHEMGHALGLPHVDAADNLMYAGPGRDPALTRALNPFQQQNVRAQAEIGPWER